MRSELVDINRFTNSPVANYNDRLYKKYQKPAEAEEKVIFGEQNSECRKKYYKQVKPIQEH